VPDLTDHLINEASKELRISPQATGWDRFSYIITTPRGDVLLPFQHGPIKEVGVNGITNEALLAIVLDRLRGFQESPFKCRENAVAITKLEEAMMWLHKRTLDRERRGVEGTNQK
jgi:hypothetical protein